MSDKGNFTTRINKDKRPGDSKPVYEGRFTVPTTGEEYGFVLFLGEDKTGRKYFSGRSRISLSMASSMTS